MTVAKPSLIEPTVDFERDGVQHGFLRLPWSRDDSAWGNLMIPIAVARNGAGPTLLAAGGNHGDEYEGPLAIVDLARNIGHQEMNGRVIMLPFMNYPAFRAGRRTSPIDGGNLNRLFPGAPDGTPTQKIADFITRRLLPLADIVVDFHSGGRTLDFLPYAASHVLEDKELEARCEAAVAAFNAPYTVKMLEIDNAGMFDTEVEAAGKTFVTTELKGGGTATPESVRVGRRGLRNVLIHAGIVEGEPELGPTRQLDMPSMDCFSFAEEDGMIELTVALGDRIRAGETIARMWRRDRTGAAPHEFRANLDGVLVARHFPGLVQTGDCVAVVGVA